MSAPSPLLIDWPQTLYWALSCFSLVVLYYAIVYPFFISPLRQVPGPKLAAITSLYQNIHYYNETGIPWIKSLHEKYGPIVRVAPNEIVVNDSELLPAIYGIRSALWKPSYASLLENYGFPNTFSSITGGDHRSRRRLVAKVYTMSANLNNARLMSWIQNRLDKVADEIDSKSLEPVDIFSLATYFALDSVSYMVFGKSFDLLGGKNLHTSEDIRHATIASVPFVRFYRLFDLMLKVWPLTTLVPDIIMKALAARSSLESTVDSQIDLVDSYDERPNPDTTTLGYLRNQPDFGKTLMEGHVKSECFDHILAGADSTAAGIIYLLYTLARAENRKYQDKLRQEISSLPDPMDFKSICNLPFLNTCVLESLRLNPPAPGAMQQRCVPTDAPVTVTVRGKAYALPPGTMVGAQAYSVHRNEAVFGSRCNEFLPERWDRDDAHLRKMKEAWIPFGSGARLCLGMNLALIEMKAITAMLIRKYLIELPAEANDADMLPMFAVVIRPKAERCELLFRGILPSL